MILYHGSNVEIRVPDLSHSRKQVDFGVGFYTTPIYEQAKNWCGKFTRRGMRGIINRYSFDESILKKYRVLKFDTYCEAWLNFVLACRKGLDQSDYDVVIGGVANDKVFNTVELFFDGLIDKTEALKRLQYEEPNLQMCFRSQEILDSCLRFEGSEVL
ncbi:MAG: DUF3990 domain-containing protein [Firmicutes bacterium]|nr:DUF3990 domain-containing protein [Bacillota bacterium]